MFIMPLLHQTSGPAPRNTPTTSSRLIAVGYVLLITAAELVTSLVDPQLGLLLNIGLLVVLLLHGALAHDAAQRDLTLALTLAPLIRILSLAMPLLHFPQVTWYPLVSVPLLLALWMIVRQGGVTRQQLGLRSGTLVLQLMLVGMGLGLGVLEYFLLRPEPMITSFGWQPILLASLSLLIFTGFTEEIIFRGLLQSLAIPVLGTTSAIFYAALLFAVLHIGYLSIAHVLFVFAVGVAFGYMVHWTGSILGVTLVHGLTNITLFLLMPYLAQTPGSVVASTAPYIIWIGTAFGAAAFVLSMVPALTQRRRMHTPSPPVTELIRSARRDAGMTYTELAERTGIPVRELAAIEDGMQSLRPQQLSRIVAGLGEGAHKLFEYAREHPSEMSETQA